MAAIQTSVYGDMLDVGLRGRCRQPLAQLLYSHSRNTNDVGWIVNFQPVNACVTYDQHSTTLGDFVLYRVVLLVGVCVTCCVVWHYLGTECVIV